MKKELKASYTLEASLLFPFILAVIVLIIYGSFFIHDRAVLDIAAYEAALRGSEVTDPDGDIFSKVRDTGNRETEGRLLATKNVSMDVRVDSKAVSVVYTGDFTIPRGVILVPGMNMKGTEIKVEGKSARDDPAGFIRECRMVEARLSDPEESEGSHDTGRKR
ncbi:MAG: pilus assembly protein [Lachnospiraceae bacterium]|nr:pilus assembly protein [Lachnospiraceae bacterium]